MDNTTPQMRAGMKLRRLIKEYYRSQQEFADAYGTDIRSVSRYVNNGIDSISTIQELASHFHLTVFDFLK